MTATASRDQDQLVTIRPHRVGRFSNKLDELDSDLKSGRLKAICFCQAVAHYHLNPVHVRACLVTAATGADSLRYRVVRLSDLVNFVSQNGPVPDEVSPFGRDDPALVYVHPEVFNDRKKLAAAAQVQELVGLVQVTRRLAATYAFGRGAKDRDPDSEKLRERIRWAFTFLEIVGFISAEIKRSRPMADLSQLLLVSKALGIDVESLGSECHERALHSFLADPIEFLSWSMANSMADSGADVRRFASREIEAILRSAPICEKVKRFENTEVEDGVAFSMAIGAVLAVLGGVAADSPNAADAVERWGTIMVEGRIKHALESSEENPNAQLRLQLWDSDLQNTDQEEAQDARPPLLARPGVWLLGKNPLVQTAAMALPPAALIMMLVSMPTAAAAQSSSFFDHPIVASVIAGLVVAWLAGVTSTSLAALWQARQAINSAKTLEQVLTIQLGHISQQLNRVETKVDK